MLFYLKLQTKSVLHDGTLLYNALIVVFFPSLKGLFIKKELNEINN